MDLLARFRMNKEISNKWFCTKSTEHYNITLQCSALQYKQTSLSHFFQQISIKFLSTNFTTSKCQIWEFKIPWENLQNILNWIYHLTEPGLTAGLGSDSQQDDRSDPDLVGERERWDDSLRSNYFLSRNKVSLDWWFQLHQPSLTTLATLFLSPFIFPGAAGLI